MGILSGKFVVVTGSSRGIGAGIAKVLAEKGATIALSYASREDGAKKVLAELPGSGHIYHQLQLDDEQSIKNYFKYVLEQFGQIDGLVNNAGMTKDQILLRMKAEDFDSVIHANLRGSFLCTQNVLKPMMKKKSGSIVHITSVIGQTGNQGQANYAASKAGLEAFSKSVAKEMASRNLRSNCVAPGFIQTEMTEVLDEKQKENIMTQIPLGRMGATEDIANAVAFLLSEEAAYITGQTLSINGGMYM
ncbi:MAG: 3-oxoacyl-[acyl-carrier-protein] reductase [Bdellovibrionales bacterium]